MGKKSRAFLGELMGVLTVLAVFVAALALLRPETEATPAPAPSPSPEQTATGGDVLRVVTRDGVVEMPLEDYVARVVSGEMPASFQPAALEAQAVAARTYALQRKESGVHAPEGDVCTDYACCQAYSDPATPQSVAAAEKTAGQVLRYGGALIQAVFHSSSLGQTATAQEVWGGSLPYLTSVATPETAADWPEVESQVGIPVDDFKAQFTRSYPTAQFGDDPDQWFQLTRSATGHVATATVGGVTVTGKDLRALFSLRSTAFEVTVANGQVTFFVHGYGHGVGMSQAGANKLAQDGAAYEEILAHYYPGTTLETYH